MGQAMRGASGLVGYQSHGLLGPLAQCMALDGRVRTEPQASILKVEIHCLRTNLAT